MKSRVRVLIVDDSAVYREFLRHTLESDPQVEVVAAVRDGAAAFEVLPALRPDVITMDINMPGMNGFDVTRKVMETYPTPIIVVSAADDAGEVQMSFKAMESGAVAVVPKVHGGGSDEALAQAGNLIQMVKLMAEVKVVKRWARRTVPAWEPGVPSEKPAAAELRSGISAVLIGASTGGPVPVRTILAALPPGFSSAVLIVQHIAAGFGRGFTEWLAAACQLPVHVAEDGEHIVSGHVYVAPDDAHMGVSEGPRILLSHDEPENGLRPAVSHLFRSASRVYGRSAAAVLLSGMGRDGAEELKVLRDLGAVTFAQDRESCVVFGMPGEAVRLDGATYSLSPEAIASAVVALAEKGKTPEGVRSWRPA
jgi:two-component system chemotaxis response regulator CheB